MKNPYKKWSDEHVFFLDEGFDGDEAYEALAKLGILIERFAQHFPDPERGREHGVADPRVIQYCNNNGWILLTTDSNMGNIHRQEIAASKSLVVLATAHNSPEDIMEWVAAFGLVLPKLRRNNFRKRERPWFACFNRQGVFSVGPKLVTWRTRPRTAEATVDKRTDSRIISAAEPFGN